MMKKKIRNKLKVYTLYYITHNSLKGDKKKEKTYTDTCDQHLSKKQDTIEI